METLKDIASALLIIAIFVMLQAIEYMVATPYQG